MNDIITVLVGGGCLGLILVTALWFYERLESWRTAAFLVTIMAVANGVSLVAKYVPESLRQDNALPLLGISEHYDFRLFLPTCLVAFIGFATVLLGWRNALRTVPIAFAFSVLGTLAFNYCVEQGRGGWINLLPGDVLGILWQMTLVLFLAVSLCIGQISLGARSSTVQASQVSSSHPVRNGFITLGILFGCFIGVQLWTRALIRDERKRDAEHLGKVRTVLAHAPSRENLPPLEQESAEKVLLPDTAGFTRYGPRLKILPAEEGLPVLEKTTPRALYPERYSYTATYADVFMLNRIDVDITAYPTVDWAGYYLKPMPVLYPGSVWKLEKFGNTIYQVGTSFLWSSGNKVILLDCRLARQPAIDAFLEAYLKKYPSSL
ncbi:MAG TPA: hypothetical protein VGJ33_18640 [Candidatus Angelobacter sp.]